MIDPAAELLAPAAAASIGITDSSRKKLVSEVNSAMKLAASGPLTSRAGTALSGSCLRQGAHNLHARIQPACW